MRDNAPFVVAPFLLRVAVVVAASTGAVSSVASCGTCNCDPCSSASVLTDDDCEGGSALGEQFSEANGAGDVAP